MKASARSLKAIMAKAEEKLASAERELAAGFPGEASSRAYYAAFHAITAVLATRGLSFFSHTQTIGAFNREFVNGTFKNMQLKEYQQRALETIRTYLEHLAELRQKAEKTRTRSASKRKTTFCGLRSWTRTNGGRS